MYRKYLFLMTTILFIVFSFSSCTKNDNKEYFAIYLIKEEYAGKSDYKKINKLELEEEPFITGKDIEKYYWNETSINGESGSYSRVPPHTFMLSSDTLYDRLEKLHRGNDLKVPFVVVANNKRIYLGMIVRSNVLSSMAIKIPEGISAEIVYTIDNPRLNRNIIKWIVLEDKDYRYDKRIKNALMKSGKLVE